MADANVSVSFSASVSDFVSQVGEAKDALQTFSAPFGEINRQLASLGTATSQAFSANHLAPYRDALSATQSLQQSFAADSARAAAALREGDEAAYADAARAAQLATSEELRILADATKQKLALYAEAHVFTLSRSGTVRAARLLAEIGDCRGRYPTPVSLICAAGCSQGIPLHGLGYGWAAGVQRAGLMVT